MNLSKEDLVLDAKTVKEEVSKLLKTSISGRKHYKKFSEICYRQRMRRIKHCTHMVLMSVIDNDVLQQLDEAELNKHMQLNYHVIAKDASFFLDQTSLQISKLLHENVMMHNEACPLPKHSDNKLKSKNLNDHTMDCSGIKCENESSATQVPSTNTGPY